MFNNDETSSLLSKKQHHQRDDLESNTFVVPSPDDDELFRGSILNKTKKNKNAPRDDEEVCRRHWCLVRRRQRVGCFHQFVFVFFVFEDVQYQQIGRRRRI